MIASAGDNLTLDLDVEGPATLDLQHADPDTRAVHAQAAMRAVMTEATAKRRHHAAVFWLLIQATTPEATAIPPEIGDAVADAYRIDRALGMLTTYILARVKDTLLEALFEQWLERRPERLADVGGGIQSASTPVRDRLLDRILSHANSDTRQHFFALLNKHRRLSPPGTLSWPHLAAHLETILRRGIDDAEPKVRERALALAFGLGKCALVRDLLVARLDDPSMNVRQYALVGLGTLDDAETLQLLLHRLRHGSQAEVQSATSALARRPDGLPHVLALLPDPRAWVMDEALGAIRNVSAPLSDEQLAALRARVTDAALPGVIEHHLWRTRDPRGREVGPDDMVVSYVRAPDAAAPGKPGS